MMMMMMMMMMKKKGKTQEGWKEEVERDFLLLGVRR